MTRRILAAVCLVISINARASDPGQAIADARSAIEGKEYQRALITLQDGLSGALLIADEKRRGEALAAIHFYRALAYSGVPNDAGARAELREFFKLHPGKSTLDPRKYPAHFLDVFTDENRRLTMTPQDATAFDQHYPGFDAIFETTGKATPVESWAMTADYQLLATDAERERWTTLRDDSVRRQFVDEFWHRRDPEPKTDANEWRTEFERRVAFADSVFTGEATRGALSDRGKVFILLGKPSRVYREPIRYAYGLFQGLNGTAERWVYFREQLPVALPTREVDFRFIDQPGYGNHALLRDVMPLQALATAQKAHAR